MAVLHLYFVALDILLQWGRKYPEFTMFNNLYVFIFIMF